MQYDATFKHLVEAYPEDWVDLFGWKHNGPVKVIDADLSTVAPKADKVFQIEEDSPWLLHWEAQSTYDAELPKRTHLYSTLLHHRHEIPVQSCVLLLRRKADGRAMTGNYTYGFQGRPSYLRFDYQLERIWQWPAERLLKGGLGTLVLAPLTDDAQDHLPEVVHQVEERIFDEADERDRGVLAASTLILLGLRDAGEVARSLLRRVMGMKDSITYQWLVAAVRAEQAQETLLNLGRLRFGEPPEEIRLRVKACQDLAELNAATERVLSAPRWEDLFALPAASQ